MDAATINAKIYAGRGKAALRLGFDNQVYRPAIASNPLTALVTTIKAAFNSGDNDYKKPNLPGKAIWFGDFDGNQTRAGDYLVGASSTYFIAGQQPLLPIICISCNRSITITRQTAQASVGAVGYGGRVPANETIILGATTPWPCSILFGGKQKTNKTGLPADVDQAGWRVMLPPSVPVTLLAGDIISDDLGKRYAIDGAELTDSGWRINATEVHA
ncbi:MAG: hypothetical protein ACXWAT_00880 [Methylobacter sp.]